MTMKAVLITAAVLILAGSTIIVLACCKISGDCDRQVESHATKNQMQEETTP